jgi:hypothetical protein
MSSASEPSVMPRQKRNDQPRAEELVGVHDGANQPRGEADAADYERPLLEPGQRRRVGDDCLRRHIFQFAVGPAPTTRPSA